MRKRKKDNRSRLEIVEGFPSRNERLSKHFIRNVIIITLILITLKYW